MGNAQHKSTRARRSGSLAGDETTTNALEQFNAKTESTTVSNIARLKKLTTVQQLSNITSLNFAGCLTK
jgi:hypothetical protein